MGPLELPGGSIVKLPRGIGLVAQDGLEDHAPVADEWSLSREHPVQDHTDRPEIGPAVQAMGFASDLLRGHVARGARDFTRRREPTFFTRRGPEGLAGAVCDADRPQRMCLFTDRQTEIGHVRIAVNVEQNIIGLEIAMNQPSLVGVIHRLRHGDHEADGIGVSQPMLAQERGQALPVDVLQDDVDGAVTLLPDIVDRDDCGVLQTGGRLRLVEERLDLLVRGERF